MSEPRCATCKWWLEGMVFESMQDGQLKHAPSFCVRFPKWEEVSASHHCGEHRDKDDPIVNPRPDAP